MTSMPDQRRHTLRTARMGDLEGVRGLLAAAALPLDGLEDQFGESYVVAEVEGDGLVGAAGVEVYGQDGLLRSVVVAASLRGTGLGKALVAERVEWARLQRLRSLYLLTTTAADFFARLGFSRIERDSVPAPVRASREFAAVCPLSATVMARNTTS